MRQAGRYLPEFREIRKKNPNFIELCLNPHLSEEITLQPIKRFNFDAAIIFSDILMVPYGMGQSVEFKKNLGPNLGNFRMTDIQKTTENDFENILEIKVFGRRKKLFKKVSELKEENFKDGLRNGLYILYNQDGTEKVRLTYKDGYQVFD